MYYIIFCINAVIGIGIGLITNYILSLVLGCQMITLSFKDDGDTR